jgi:hypothetical protein
MWTRLTTVSINGRDVWTLAPEDLLVFLSVHGAKHLWAEMKWLCDVAELARSHPDLNWTAVTERARRAGAARMVQLAAELARELLEVEHPLPAPRVVRSLAVCLRDRMFSETAPVPSLFGDMLFHTRLTANPWRKIRYCAATVAMPTEVEWEALRLPPVLYPLYYLVRPVRLLFKHAWSKLGRRP